MYLIQYIYYMILDNNIPLYDIINWVVTSIILWFILYLVL